MPVTLAFEFLRLMGETVIFLSWRDTTGGAESVSPPSALLPPLLSQKVAYGTMLLAGGREG